MKDFPIFETLISSLDVKREFKEYFDLKEKQREEIVSAFGINIVIDETLPSCSALFIDHKKRIVGIYKDGELVYSPRKDGENCVLRYPTAFKKKGDQEQDANEEAG